MKKLESLRHEGTWIYGEGEKDKAPGALSANRKGELILELYPPSRQIPHFLKEARLDGFIDKVLARNCRRMSGRVVAQKHRFIVAEAFRGGFSISPEACEVTNAHTGIAGFEGWIKQWPMTANAQADDGWNLRLKSSQIADVKAPNAGLMLSFGYSSHQNAMSFRVNLTPTLSASTVKCLLEDADREILAPALDFLCFASGLEIEGTDTSFSYFEPGKPMYDIRRFRTIWKKSLAGTRSGPELVEFESFGAFASAAYPKWVELYQKARVAFELYLNARAGTHPSIESRLLAVLQALEVLHRRLDDGKYLPKEEFDAALVAMKMAVGPAVPAQIKEAVEEKLRWANEFSLRHRLKGYLAIVPLMKMVFGPSDAKIAGNLTDLRNFFTHYGEPGQEPPDARRIRSGLILARCLFETVVLQKLGAPESALKVALSWARERIELMQ